MSAQRAASKSAAASAASVLLRLDVGAHVGRRQQAHLDAQGAQPARPVVRAAAGFHHDQPDGAVGEPALELGAGEALALEHFPVAVGNREFEHELGEIDAHDRQRSGSIHLGLPSVER